MDKADFPWRPLGRLLVDEELLEESDLERALAEQRRTGRLLGQILVEQGHMTAVALARTLARQHGVELRSAAAAGELNATLDNGAEGRRRGLERWRPLGAVLVDSGLVAEADLEDALMEKRRHTDRRLGQILVESGYLTGAELEWALAEQHGLELETHAVAVEVEAVSVPVPAGQPTYQVVSVPNGNGRERKVLYEGPNLLDAADFACDYVDREQPHAVEIERLDGGERETVWTYSSERAEAEASSRKSLVETFGFDPTRWGTAT